MRSLVPYVDVVIANEEDADLSLGIRAPESDVDAGELNVRGYIAVAEQITQQFPNVKQVAITLRESLSASHNNWGAMLYTQSQQQAVFAPCDSDGNYSSYRIHNIVDLRWCPDLCFEYTGAVCSRDGDPLRCCRQLPETQHPGGLQLFQP